MIITFDVGGKLFKTRQSSIITNDVLNMLVEHHESPIFIDRDPKMFRWILYIQREGLMVDHITVGVPKDVWELELDYYGIRDEEHEKRKKLYHLLIESNSRDFQFAESETLSDIGKTLGGHVFDIDWLDKYRDELNSYVSTLGYHSEMGKIRENNANNFSHYPAYLVNRSSLIGYRYIVVKWINIKIYKKEGV